MFPARWTGLMKLGEPLQYLDSWIPNPEFLMVWWGVSVIGMSASMLHVASVWCLMMNFGAFILMPSPEPLYKYTYA